MYVFSGNYLCVQPKRELCDYREYFCNYYGGLGVGAIIDRRRFIYFEIPLIFLSHISIMVAALGIVN